MLLSFGKNVYGSECFREKLTIYKDGRTAVLYDYNGDLLKFYKRDNYDVDITITSAARRHFWKMQDLKMLAVPKAKYYEYGRYSGIVMDKISGRELQDSFGTNAIIRDKIVAGYLLSKDLQTLNRRKLVWGDIHLRNIMLGEDGNCYGVDVDEVYRPKRDVYPFMLYEVVADYTDLKLAINSDQLKLMICMISYIFDVDLQTLIKVHGIRNILKLLEGTGVLDYIHDKWQRMVEERDYSLYYHEMVDKLLDFDDEELVAGEEVLKMKLANASLRLRGTWPQ